MPSTTWKISFFMNYLSTGFAKRLLPVLLLATTGSVSLFGLAEEAYYKPAPAIIGHEPWEPDQGVQPKVIYGDDDRIDIYEEQDSDIVAWSSSVCGVISATRLTQLSSGEYQLSTSSYTQFGLPPCPEEPFGDQPVAANCTGFMVGEDLIVTAGHCYNQNSLHGMRFVFGFKMEDSATPVLTFSEDQVYRGVEIVARQYTFDNDWAVIRVDRPITAPGAKPLPLRRQGVVEVGEQVGVIGHPAGLPMKIAFGDQTVVRDSSHPYYFVANLDTFGGNSGSPIFNQNTGIVEGILVRGEVDYVRNGNCFVSNVFSNTGGRGEDVSKSTAFEQHVPQPEGLRILTLSRSYYTCFDSLTVEVQDLLAPLDSVEVTVLAQSGDVETFSLTENEAGSGIFVGHIPLLEGAASPEDGIVDVIDGDIITVVYQYEENGESQELYKEAVVDCTPPVIEDVEVVDTGASWATIRFQTSEQATSRVRYGYACDDLGYQASDILRSSHEITLTSLEPDLMYYFSVEATDRAGNVSEDDNGGACYTFSTALSVDYFTNHYHASAFDLEFTQLTFSPQPTVSGYSLCVDFVEDFAVAPYGGEVISLDDDAFVLRTLSGGRQVELYGQRYDRVYIGSNGFLTFLGGDTEFQPSLENHFNQPRVAPLFTDLNPEPRGDIYYEQLSDRIVVSYVDVPVWDLQGEYTSDNSNTVQVEMFYNGAIRFTYLDVSTENSVVGISRGLGLLDDYSPSAFLLDYPVCQLPLEARHSADINGDGVISLSETLRVVQLYAFGAYHCDDSTEDGYAPGDGPTTCAPHDSDYNPQDWQISMSELLRVIQFYQSAGYQVSEGTEDGFAPLP